MTQKKRAFVINGKGGVGKDTLVDAYSLLTNQPALNASAIDIIKDIAYQYGWHGEKDLKARKFLSELKRVFIEYNDLPTSDLLRKYYDFMDDNQTDYFIMFVHIREPEEIQKFIEGTNHEALSILIRRKGISDKHYGNPSDDNVDNYNYDIIFDNDKPVEESAQDFKKMVDKLI